MKYIISFNNGHKMKIDVKNGAEFITALCKGVKERPNDLQQFWKSSDILINFNEITAVHPEAMDDS
jgi:hypothetical protein